MPIHKYSELPHDDDLELPNLYMFFVCVYKNYVYFLFQQCWKKVKFQLHKLGIFALEETFPSPTKGFFKKIFHSISVKKIAS